MSRAASLERTDPSERCCRCLLLWRARRCRSAASVAACGAILNRSVFPECLWLIWHFCVNPESLALQPAALSFSLSVLPHPSLSRAFRCLTQGGPLLQTSIIPYFHKLVALTHFVPLFKPSSGELQSIWALISPLRCKWMRAAPCTGLRKKKKTPNCQWVYVQEQSPACRLRLCRLVLLLFVSSWFGLESN